MEEHLVYYPHLNEATSRFDRRTQYGTTHAASVVLKIRTSLCIALIFQKALRRAGFHQRQQAIAYHTQQAILRRQLADIVNYLT